MAAARETWQGVLADGAEGDVAVEIRREIAALDGVGAPQAPSDPSSMIRSMVDGLEQRLSLAPLDSEGWVRLVKSRIVLGETDKARSAKARALDVFAADPQARHRIEAAAKDAGL
jgi:cytochrome c-type biogenesis protein CcmH/NrfG